MKLFDELTMLPLSFESRPIGPDISSNSVHFTRFPLPIIPFSIGEDKFPFTLLLSFYPIAGILRTVMVVHCSLSMPTILLPVPFIDISILIFVQAMPFFFVLHPCSFIPLTVRIDIRTFPILFIFSPFP